MPTFCRHNRLLQNCTICAREQHFDARPVVSSSAPKSTQPREQTARPDRPRAERTSRSPRSAGARSGAGGLRVRRLARGVEDGYSSPLVPGLKSSEDAQRLAEEIALSATRLSVMDQVAAGAAPEHVPAAWHEIAAPGDLDERTRLAMTVVVSEARSFKSGNRDPALAGFEAWGARNGSLGQALTGEPSWTPERRFERDFERLGGIRGLERDARFELLTLLGGLRVFDLRAGRLFLSGENEATWAAKRALGIGDPLLLERRAAELAQACGVPLASLDLALHNWEAGTRVNGGLAEDAEPHETLLEQARSALEL